MEPKRSQTSRAMPPVGQRNWDADRLFRLDPAKQSPPCLHCRGHCCKRGASDQEFAVVLLQGEARHYDKAQEVRSYLGSRYFVVPYVGGRCVYLGGDDRCTIYDRRPKVCRRFNCLSHWLGRGTDHGTFFEDRPQALRVVRAHATFRRIKVGSETDSVSADGIPQLRGGSF